MAEEGGRKRGTNSLTRYDLRSKRQRSVATGAEELCALIDNSKWTKVINSCERHPEAASGTFRYRNENLPSALHYLVTRKPNAPYKVFDAVIKAFPGAVTMQSPETLETPLQTATVRINFRQNSLKVFKLLVERSRVPSVKTLESALPLPPEVLQEHIVPFMGDPLLLPYRTGDSILHRFFWLHYRGKQQSSTEAIQVLLTAAPVLAEFTNIFNATPLRMAVTGNAPFDQLSLLVRYFPDALLMKDGLGQTPLRTFIGRVQNSLCFPSMDILKLLAGTLPRAVLIPDNDGDLPFVTALTGFLPDAAWLNYLHRLTAEQRSIPLTDEERKSGMFE